MEEKQFASVPWKVFITTTIESLLAFYLATFCFAMYVVHRGINWIPTVVLLAILYLFVIAVCIKRVFSKLNLASIMLIIPIAPLIALIIVVTLIPVLELFR